MKSFIRALLVAVVAGTTLFAGGAAAQASQKGQPKTAFAVSDFAKLRWLEGSWAGTAPGESPIYERCHFANDSTIDITYYRDPALASESGTGRVYLTTGRIYYTFGPGRWGASHVGNDAIFLVPQVNAHNTFGWKQLTPDTWTSTVRSGVSGQDRITVYQMTRAAHP
jgi:hypothetical protein